MRLIDADELINAIEKSRNNNPHKDRCAMRKHDTEHAHFAKMVSDQPTAFDKEKVIEALKEEGCIIDDEAGNRAVEIIQKGGIE